MVEETRHAQALLLAQTEHVLPADDGGPSARSLDEIADADQIQGGRQSCFQLWTQESMSLKGGKEAESDRETASPTERESSSQKPHSSIRTSGVRAAIASG